MAIPVTTLRRTSGTRLLLAKLPARVSDLKNSTLGSRTDSGIRGTGTTGVFPARQEIQPGFNSFAAPSALAKKL